MYTHIFQSKLNQKILTCTELIQTFRLIIQALIVHELRSSHPSTQHYNLGLQI